MVSTVARTELSAAGTGPVPEAAREETGMSIGGFADKAKEMAEQHPDQIDQGVEKAGDAVDERTGGQHAEQVDKAQDAVEDRLGGGAGEQAPA